MSTNAPPATIRVTIPFSPAVHEGLRRGAERDHRELTEFIQRVLTEYLMEKELLEKVEEDRIRLMWKLVDQAVATAQNICRDGGFTAAITLNAIQACMKDPKWVSCYREFVQDDIYKNGNPRKGIINREIGFRIRAGIGGETVKGPDGKNVSAKVLGEIIQTYTPMVDFDRAQFGPDTRRAV